MLERSHLKSEIIYQGGKKNLTIREDEGIEVSLTGFWQSQHFNLFTLLKICSHIPDWFIQKSIN